MSNPAETKPTLQPAADWNAPKPPVLTEATWWPAALAFGITLAALGLITSAIIFAMGLIAASVSLAGWIKDICHERNES